MEFKNLINYVEENKKDHFERVIAENQKLKEEMYLLDFENYQKDELLYQEQQKFLEWNLKLNTALDRVDRMEQGIKTFVDKNFTGGSKSNREDYSQMVSTKDIYELRKLITD